MDEWQHCLLNVVTGHELDVWHIQVVMEDDLPDLLVIEDVDADGSAHGNGKSFELSYGTSLGPSTSSGGFP